MLKFKPYLILFVLLVLFWISLSGVFHPIQVIFGLMAIVFTTIINIYINKHFVDKPYKFSVNILKYIKYNFWLVIEVFKSSINVSKAIISSNVEPTIIYMPHNLKTEQAISILANSITLTPGTISVNANDEIIIIHSLQAINSIKEFNKTMNDKVAELEK